METCPTITIGWDKGDKYAEIDSPPCRIKNRIKKLHDEHPEEFHYYYENEDGSIYAQVPVKWIRIQRPSDNHREFTEEERQANAERFRKMWEMKKAQVSKT